MSAFNFLRHVSDVWVSAVQDKEASGCSHPPTPPPAPVPGLPVLSGKLGYCLQKPNLLLRNGSSRVKEERLFQSQADSFDSGSRS